MNGLSDRNLLDKYFPLTQTQVTAGHHGTAAMQGFLRSGVKATESKRLKKGMKRGTSHAIYSGGDVGGWIPKEYEMIIRRGARWVSVSEEYMSGVIEEYEKRWRKKQRRGNAEKKGEEEEEEEEQDDGDANLHCL